MRDLITKTYAKSVERQIASSTIVGVSFNKVAKRMDGDWDVRWVWSIEVSDSKYKQECKWEGFKTLPSCLKNLDAAICKIIKMEKNDKIKDQAKGKIVKPIKG